MTLFPKLTREELIKEEQRLEQTVKRHLLLAFPFNLCVVGIIIFVANSYFSYQFGAEELVLLVFVANITIASDWLQLRNIHKKLQRQWKQNSRALPSGKRGCFVGPND